MAQASDTSAHQDPLDLGRFLSAQEPVYTSVLSELRSGRKHTHWMWFIFPQIEGLGYSSTSTYYAIKGLEQARRYLMHPVLGARLRECTQLVLDIEGRTALEVFGSPDDLKLKSCMTLFAAASQGESLFARVLEKYFQGQRDSKTLAQLERA
jgi:uncharacterized protein (DUF1810 family)